MWIRAFGYDTKMVAGSTPGLPDFLPLATDEEVAPVVRHRTVSDVSLGSSVSPGSAGVTER